MTFSSHRVLPSLVTTRGAGADAGTADVTITRRQEDMPMFAYRVWAVARIVSAGELMLICARDKSRMLIVPA